MDTLVAHEPPLASALPDSERAMAAVSATHDKIRMKRAAGRRKDLLAIEELAALRDELDQQSA